MREEKPNTVDESDNRTVDSGTMEEGILGLRAKSVSRIFEGSYAEKPEDILPIKSAWFPLGYQLDETQQVALVRAFQTFPRIMEPDVSFKKLKFGTKIFLSGPVGNEAKEK